MPFQAQNKRVAPYRLENLRILKNYNLKERVHSLLSHDLIVGYHVFAWFSLYFNSRVKYL
jgi:hypothetical protein